MVDCDLLKGEKLMKKLICIIGHNKSIMKLKDCEKEKFENNNRAITVYKCKYCGEDVVVVTRHINGQFKNAFEK